jgi:hypothetical protein
MSTKITPASIFQEISQMDDSVLPPVHLWDPPLCENVDMRIDREGKWYFMNSPIGRERMVKLFSRVLRFDDDGFYYLVTPIEKIRLLVEDKPFLIIDYSIKQKNNRQIITFITNTYDEFELSSKHPLRVVINEESNEPSPYALVRSNLEGLISRNVFYKLVDVAEEFEGSLGIWSNNTFFKLS